MKQALPSFAKNNTGAFREGHKVTEGTDIHLLKDFSPGGFEEFLLSTISTTVRETFLQQSWGQFFFFKNVKFEKLT